MMGDEDKVTEEEEEADGEEERVDKAEEESEELSEIGSGDEATSEDGELIARERPSGTNAWPLGTEVSRTGSEDLASMLTLTVVDRGRGTVIKAESINTGSCVCVAPSCVSASSCSLSLSLYRPAFLFF